MPLRGYGRKFGGIGVVVKRPMSGRGRGLMRLPSYLPRIKTRGAGRRRRRRRGGRCCGGGRKKLTGAQVGKLFTFFNNPFHPSLFK